MFPHPFFFSILFFYDYDMSKHLNSIYAIYVIVINMTDKITSIRCRESTRNKIASFGNVNQSMEDVLQMLIQNYEENQH